VTRADRGQGRERLEVSTAAVTDLDAVALQAVRRHQGAELLVIALATEGTAQPLGAPVAATASAPKMPSAVESADFRQGRPSTAYRTVVVGPARRHTLGPGPPACLEHRHGDQRRQPPQHAAVVPLDSRDVVKAIDVLRHR